MKRWMVPPPPTDGPDKCPTCSRIFPLSGRGRGEPFEHLQGLWVKYEDVPKDIQELSQSRDWNRSKYEALRNWLPHHRRCLFCGSDIELRQCVCGKMPCITLNDIDYAFTCFCECGRRAEADGGSPLENHDNCVKAWNTTGWNEPRHT